MQAFWKRSEERIFPLVFIRLTCILSSDGCTEKFLVLCACCFLVFCLNGTVSLVSPTAVTFMMLRENLQLDFSEQCLLLKLCGLIAVRQQGIKLGGFLASPRCAVVKSRHYQWLYTLSSTREAKLNYN